MAAVATPTIAPQFAQAQAQSDAELTKLRGQLVGARPRTWVKERVDNSMGSSSDCTGGETYRFQADGKVRISRCVNGRVKLETVSWTMKRSGPLDVEIVFAGRTYVLSFGGTDRAPKMRWQALGSSKASTTTDIYLGLSKD